MRKPLWMLLALVAVPLHAQDVERWDLSRPRVAVRFNVPLLRDVGLTVTPAGRPSRDAYEAYELGAEGRLVALAPGSIFRTVATGDLRLTAAPDLAWRGGAASLRDARLRPGAEPRSFTITAADGSPLFFADHQHHTVDRKARRLRLFNLDLRLSPALARRLGEPRHGGLAVGVLEIEFAAGIPEGAVELAGGGCLNPDWGRPHNDVGLIGVTQVQQVGTPAGGVVAIAPSATLRNVGMTDVPWRAKFTAPAPPYNNDQHPFLVWNMYRVANGALQQIGASGLKHAFLTTNFNCSCSDPHVLGLNCEDTYSVGNNDSSVDIGVRTEVTAHTGVWKRCGSMFDVNCDGIPNSVPPFSPGDKRRMGVLEDDLRTPPGAQYYFEAWYVVRDDVNIFNTMGYRQVNPVFGGASWSFGLLTTLTPGPAIDAWVSPASPGPNADSQRVTTEEGHLTLAVRATDLAGGWWRYEYALMNHDYDRRIRSFSVPLPAGAIVTNMTFHDVDRDPATDWVATVTPDDQIVWQVPPPRPRKPIAPLDWGRLDSFGFEANVAPSAPQGVIVRLGIMGAQLGALHVPILGPSAP